MEMLARMGPFKFDRDDENDKTLPFIGTHLFLSDNSYYIGQWKQGLRHGRGISYWEFGNIYEGYWKMDVCTKYGRLIRANGDCYEGEWFNQKADGKGTYYKLNGDVY